MKVLFICSGNGSAGISSFIRSQGESLRNAGIEIDYFPVEGKGAKGYLKAILMLRSLLKKKQYDLLHAHYGLSALLALFARRQEKIVVSFMGDDIIGSNRFDGTLTMSGRSLAALNAFLAGRCYDHAIVKSAEMLGKLKGGERTLIPNGVDFDRFKPKSKSSARAVLNIPSEQKLVIFVSDPKRAEKNFALANLAVHHLADDRVILLPVFDTPHEVLADVYCAADVLLLTSFHEGSPNVVKEAMACNCPIVTTDVGDVKWVLGNTDGCFVSTFSVDDVSSKIKLAMEFSEKYERTTGRERILALGLDTSSIAEKIKCVYKKVVN